MKYSSDIVKVRFGFSAKMLKRSSKRHFAHTNSQKPLAPPL